MTLNVDKHKDVLVSAWKEVVDEKNPTDWALFGYDGLSYDLNLVGKGDGGLEELIEEFNSGKIMYALCRVKIKEKNVEKVILINWQGEGAPLARKGTCANHVSDIKSFFKGIHVTINARTDEDVETDLILQTVAKATAGDGVKVSGSSEVEASVGPVGTVYKRVNPKEEINTSAKDEFWRKEEQEEERRKKEEQNKLRRFSQNEVKLLRRESQDYFNDAEKAVPSNNASRVNGSNNISSAEAVKASTPMKSSSSNAGDLVRQRIKSFDHGSTPLTSQLSSNGAANGGSSDKSAESLSVLKRRQMFEGGALHNTTTSRVSPAQEIKKAQEEAQKLQKKQQESSISTTTNKTENNTYTPIKPPAVPVAAPIKQIPDVVPQSKAVPVTPPPAVITESVTNVVPQSKAVPVTPPPAVITEPVASAVTVEKTNGHSNNGIAKTSPVAEAPHNGNGHEQEHLQVEQNREEDAATPTIEILPEMGTCARALYDYQAADESEITFDPGDIITNIEKIDEGWWEGLGPHGVYGLFPANYVELLN